MSDDHFVRMTAQLTADEQALWDRLVRDDWHLTVVPSELRVLVRTVADERRGRMRREKLLTDVKEKLVALHRKLEAKIISYDGGDRPPSPPAVILGADTDVLVILDMLDDEGIVVKELP